MDLHIYGVHPSFIAITPAFCSFFGTASHTLFLQIEVVFCETTHTLFLQIAVVFGEVTHTLFLQMAVVVGEASHILLPQLGLLAHIAACILCTPISVLNGQYLTSFLTIDMCSLLTDGLDEETEGAGPPSLVTSMHEDENKCTTVVELTPSGLNTRIYHSPVTSNTRRSCK